MSHFWYSTLWYLHTYGPIRVKTEAVKVAASHYLKYKYSHLFSMSLSFALPLLIDLHNMLHSTKILEHQ